MATLSGNIRPQNIIDRYADFVTATANNGLTWHKENKPFEEFDGNILNSGSSRSIGITGSNIDPAGVNITPGNIYNTLLAETATYTNIRNLTAILFVEGGGGNTGSRPAAGVVFNGTAKTHFTTDYRQSLPPVTQGIAAGQDITVVNLEALFVRMREAYNNRADENVTVQVNVCHASCHSSCHGSRGRR
jgi:hypothetical protein